MNRTVFIPATHFRQCPLLPESNYSLWKNPYFLPIKGRYSLRCQLRALKFILLAMIETMTFSDACCRQPSISEIAIRLPLSSLLKAAHHSLERFWNFYGGPGSFYSSCTDPPEETNLLMTKQCTFCLVWVRPIASCLRFQRLPSAPVSLCRCQVTTIDSRLASRFCWWLPEAKCSNNNFISATFPLQQV